MSDLDIDEIAKNPKFKFRKNKNKLAHQRTVDDLFKNQTQSKKLKDKRGRPWISDPQKYAQECIDAEATESEDDSKSYSTESSGAEEDSDTVLEEFPEGIDPAEFLKSSEYADLERANYLSLIQDAPKVDNETSKLALVHFDWENGKAEDIFLLLQSFLPKEGSIKKVTIYPSEFGMQRMEEEETSGPLELRTAENIDADRDDQVYDLDDKSAWHSIPENLKSKLRDYELARLKYYYAVIEFNNVETAKAVYTICDGMEYEASGTCLDLRYVPEDMKFEVDPKWSHLVSSCNCVNTSRYKPKKFETKALNSTRLGLGWDSTPKERTNWLKSQFKDDKSDPLQELEKDPSAREFFLLSSSGASTAASSDVDDPGPAETVPRIRKHRPPKVAPDRLRKLLLGDISKRKEDENAGESSSEEEYDLNSTDDEERTETKILQPQSTVDQSDESQSSDSNLEEDSPIEEPQDIILPRKRGKAKFKAIMKEKLKLKKRMKTKEKRLWKNSDDTALDDDRFDTFWTHPGFKVDRTHKHYDKAKDFLDFMKERKISTKINTS